MLRKFAVLGLGLACGGALADPVGNTVGGATGLLSGTLNTLPAGPALPGAPSLPGTGGPAGAGIAGGVAAGQPLPGLQPSNTALPGLEQAEGEPADGELVGVSVLQTGPDGSGYGDVLTVDQETVIDDQFDGRVNQPLVGGTDNGGLVDIAILDGNDTAHAGPDGLLSAAVLSGDDTATGGAVGVAVLSGTGSGQGDVASLGVANDGDLLHACLGGDCLSGESLPAGQGGSGLRQTEVQPGVVVGGGASSPVTSSNPVANVGVLTGDNAGTGGLVGVGVVAGNGSGQGDLVGACVLCGAGAGTGSLGVAVLSGADGGTGAGGILPVGVGTAVLGGSNSGNGTLIGAAILSGGSSGSGGVTGVGVLPTVGPTGRNSGPGPGGGVPVPGFGPAPATHIAGGGGGGGGAGVKVPGAQGGGDVVPDDAVAMADDSATDEEGMDLRRGACLIVVKNVRDVTTQSVQRACRGRRAT